MPESLPPPHQINPQISPDIAQIVLAAMAPHPKDRPVSVAAWQQMLHSLDTTQPMGSRPPAGNDWPATLRENWWLIGIAVVLFIAAVRMTFG